jgi:cytochrome c5
MSAAPSHDDDYEPNHEGPIRTPKQLILAVLFAFIIPVGTIVLLASYVTSANKPGAGTEVLNSAAVAARTAPVGQVAVKDASDPASMKSGAEVYTAQCAVCHAAGVAQAPKFGDAAAWAPRLQTGYDALLASALKGKGVMAAQGGGDFSDVEIGRAVVHMSNAAGAQFPEPSAGAAPAAADAASAPAATAAVAPVATPAAPAAEAAPVVAAAAPAAATAAPALYTQICSACHVAGLANAPKLGDKAAWAPRLAAGVDGLTASVIKGKGAMPPKGGAMAAADADIKAAVAYMVGSVK